MSSHDRGRGQRGGEDDTLADVGADTFDGRDSGPDALGATVDSASSPSSRDAASSGKLPARGDRFAHFEVLDVLGRGGMSVVLAAHDVALDRTIALKVMRTEIEGGSHSSSVQQRLLREAQALARLSHPNVVTVHEVGVEGERVYLAMELVDGSTLTTWLAATPRTWREVVAVFRQAGAGLAAAHAAGFVHRDVKPDNILVRRDGHVVVTDFGLVSATVHDPGASGNALPATSRLTPVPGTTTPLSALTHTGTMLGTPAYMAPEQHLHRSVDARADQFGFCVSLFEALYGKRPFRGQTYGTLRDAVLAGRVRDAPADSTVPAWLRKVVLRGLATDPDARYPSMDALLVDLAADPSQRRRRTVTFAAVGGAFVAVAGLAVLGFTRTQHASAPSPCQVSAAELTGAWDPERRAAIERAFGGTRRVHAAPTFARASALLDARATAWLDMRRDACLATRVRGAQSEHLLDLRTQCLERRKEELGALTALLARGSDPDVLNRAVSAINALTPVAVCADTEALAAIVPLPDEPAARARVLALGRRLDEVEALGRTGQWKAAVEPATTAAAEARAIAHVPTLARALLALGRTLDKAGQPQEAEATLREALDAAAGARDHVTIARAWIDLIEVVGHVQVRFDDALAMEQSAAVAVKVTGDPMIAAELERTLGRVLLKKGDFAAARVHAEAAVAGFERAAGKDAAPVAASLQGLAIISDRQGKFDEARAHYERALAIFRTALGDDHPAVGGVLNDLGALMSHRDRHADARPYYEQAVGVLERALGPEHPHVATVSYNLGILTRDLGDNDAALAHFEKAEQVYAAALGPEHADVGSAIASQATTLRILGRYDESRAGFDRALALVEKAVGPDHIETAVVLESLALLEQDVGQYDAARARYDRILAIEEKAYGKDNPEVSDTLLNLGNLEAVRQRYGDARRHLDRALALAVKGHGETSVTAAMVVHALADLDRQQGRHASAIARYQVARGIFEKELGAAHPNLGVTLSGLGQSQIAAGDTLEGIETLRAAIRIAEKTPADPTTLPLARLALGRALWEEGMREYGHALVQDAAARLADLGPGMKSTRAAAEKWLRTHSPRH